MRGGKLGYNCKSMKKSTLSNLKKVAAYLKKESRRKYITLDMVSRSVGIYSDILADDLSFLNPVLLMDPSVNMKDYLEPLEEAIYQEENKRKDSSSPRYEAVTKKELALYPSIQEFMYQKLTNAGGLVDTSITLSDHDLRVLKKLVERETSERRKAKRLAKKK